MTDFLSQLPEASYEGKRFPVVSAETRGGNDVAQHVAYRRRGADVEFTGLRAYQGTFTIPLVNTPALVAKYGDLALGLRADLLDLFETRPIGSLQHPTYGLLTAAITEWSEPIDSSARNGVTWSVSWVEHNGTAGVLTGPDGALSQDTTTTVEELATAADTQAASVGVHGYTRTAPVVSSQVSFLESAPRSFTQVSDAFRQMSGVINANLALAGMVGTTANAATRAQLTLRSAIDAMRGQYVVGDARMRFYTPATSLAAWEVSQMVYGRPDGVRRLLEANAFTDPLLIPAGTVIRVVPWQ
jgi:prophage DNA circulation protein